MTSTGRGKELTALTRLAAELACGNEVGLRAALRDAAQVVSASAVEEVLLQSHLFVGFPVILNAFIVWRELAPAEGQTPSIEVKDEIEVRQSAGERLCARVYGQAYDQLRANVRALSLDLDRWMIEDGYGKTLSRAELDPVMRELCIVALLAAAGHTRQLRSHLHGALNVGATAEDVDRTVRLGAEVAGERRETERRDPAAGLAVWRAVRERTGV